MENTEQKVYPRIWDYSGERKIVGETKLSWIVVRRRQEDAEWVPHVQGLYDDKKSFLFSRLIDWQYLKSRDYVELVNKKALQDSPNQQRPQWFLSEESRADYVFCVQHRSDIGRAVATGNHDAATDEVEAIASAFDPTQIQRVTAIPTTWNGVTFRSRTEARWSIFFDYMEIEWEYEPEGLELANGARYLPDFYLPRFRWWCEVKPTGEILQKERKSITFCSAADIDLLLLVGNPDFKEYDAVCGYDTHWTFCLDTDYHGTDDENRFWSCGDCQHEYSDRYRNAVLAARGARF